MTIRYLSLNAADGYWIVRRQVDAPEHTCAVCKKRNRYGKLFQFGRAMPKAKEYEIWWGDLYFCSKRHWEDWWRND